MIERAYIYHQGTLYHRLICPRCHSGSMLWEKDKKNVPYLECIACSHELSLAEIKKSEKSEKESAKISAKQLQTTPAEPEKEG